MDRRTVVISTSIFIILVMGGVGWYLSGPSIPASPPEIVLEADGEGISGVEGSFCWEDGCVDKFGPGALVDRAGLNATTLPRDALIRFTVPDGRQPVSYDYTVYYSNNSVVGSDFAVDAFTLSSLEPGTYLLVVHGRWNQGSASYVFKIRLTS